MSKHLTNFEQSQIWGFRPQNFLKNAKRFKEPKKYNQCCLLVDERAWCLQKKV